MASLSTCHLGLWLGWQILLNLVKCVVVDMHCVVVDMHCVVVDMHCVVVDIHCVCCC